MDSTAFHIQQEDQHGQNNHANEGVSKRQSSIDHGRAVVRRWLDEVVPASPGEPETRSRLRSQTPRPPLQPLQQQPSAAKHSKDLTNLSTHKAELNLRACRRLPKMADQTCLPQPSARRGRGRPRKSGQHLLGRGARDTDQQASTQGAGNGNGASRARGIGGRGRPGQQQSIGRLRAADRGRVPQQLSTDRTDDLFYETAHTESDPDADRPANLVLPPLTLLPSSSSRRSPSRSPTRSSKTSSAVVKRSQLAFVKPAVHFLDHSGLSRHGGLPEIAQDLWLNHLSAALQECASIPLGLKDRLLPLIDTPRKSRPELSRASFTSGHDFDDSDCQTICTTALDVIQMANRYRNRAPESHWLGTVVAPLLHLVRRLRFSNSSDDTEMPLLEVTDLATTEISPPSLCPYSDDPELFKTLDKRIDYGIGLLLRDEEVCSLQRAHYNNAGIPSINQTSDFVNFTPLFAHFEVKKRHVSKDPLIQLAAWIAAEFNKRKIEGYSLEMPVFAVAIDGDFWELYVVYAENGLAEDYRLIFLGPFDVGHTKTLPGIFQIVNMLCSLSKWGLGPYREWFDREVLDRNKTHASLAACLDAEQNL